MLRYCARFPATGAPSKEHWRCAHRRQSITNWGTHALSLTPWWLVPGLGWCLIRCNTRERLGISANSWQSPPELGTRPSLNRHQTLTSGAYLLQHTSGTRQKWKQKWTMGPADKFESVHWHVDNEIGQKHQCLLMLPGMAQYCSTPLP